METSILEVSEPTVEEPQELEDTLSIVLFSGTDDRLNAAAVLAAGAAAMGRNVRVFLQYWALVAFLKGWIEKDHGISPEAGPAGAEAIRLLKLRGGYQHWSETFRQAKDIGDVQINACALSMDMFGVAMENLDPLVDGVQGVAAFMADATGPITFI